MKIAIAGAWHVHAAEYTQSALNYGEVVGVYDPDPKRRAEFAARFGIPEFATYEQLLENDAEAVIVATATNIHRDIIVRAAQVGKHIFTEKVLALTEEDAEAIRTAVVQKGVRFVISFPWKFNAGIMAVLDAVDSGAVGRVNYVRFRNCHNGSVAHWLPAHFYSREQCGGGAMIDLGAHGMYLAHRVLGEPESYRSAFTHFCRDDKDAVMNTDAVEDNAVTIMTYADGAIAINETGFVSVGSSVAFEVGGDRGYIRFDGAGAVLNDCTGSSSLTLPTPGMKPIDAFVQGLNAPGCGIDEACALTRMMLGAYGAV